MLPMNSQTSIESLALGYATLLPGNSLGEMSRPSTPRRADTVPANEAAWRDILRLWLTWNEVHEQVGARMFKSGENLQELEDLLDHADQLRFEAVRRSKSLLTGKPRQS
jgi:hypothetical protein